VTINRVSNGESNVDHNPGGESLHLEKDKWYKVKVNLGEGNKVSAFIDGKKVFEQMASAPTGHYTAAGYDESAGETVIKVVNSTNEPYDATIVMNASKVLPEGKAITLSASDKKAENSMENPEMTVHRP
jgi:alpha-L-arabinofuranosidase